MNGSLTLFRLSWAATESRDGGGQGGGEQTSCCVLSGAGGGPVVEGRAELGVEERGTGDQVTAGSCSVW